ncbi:hypothetical protein GCM10011529_29610 [Polymorphobacter glacialis]|uniref:Sec-independent protein translocase protein TatB n=1 Tax=Sandarakinorhabdus glacialis TaxID=1614636 RepID=A0A917EB98_9SPHN|nr:twin-arginine translocase TatA/TatE family subunit [Polymorphobacter glacialis]GGE21073.1 hypothetical protein GCM10011529_29610 [Polymorphobacter glacialis]
MFGIDSTELAIIALVALLVIGPRDLPRVMRMVGNWLAKGRAMTRHVRAGFDTMMREAELEEMQKAWAAQNEAIMKASALPDLGLSDPLAQLGASDPLALDDWSAPPPSTPTPETIDVAAQTPAALAAPDAAQPKKARTKASPGPDAPPRAPRKRAPKPDPAETARTGS